MGKILKLTKKNRITFYFPAGHLLGVLPSLLLPGFAAAAYLIAFCLGTCVAMAIFTSCIGEISLLLGRSLKQPELPAVLSRWSSLLAIFVGLAWIVNGVTVVLSHEENI